MATERRTATRPRAGKLRAEYVENHIPKDEHLELGWVGSPPQLTVLGVDDVEGDGTKVGERWNRWRYVLTWET